MFTETQHDNMYLNLASNVIAIVLGCIAAISHQAKISIPTDTISILTNPNTIEFILRTAVGGVIAFAVKVGGDLFLIWLKNRKNKGGENE